MNMDRRTSSQSEEGEIILKTSSMGVINSAKGKSAQIIQSQINNSQVNSAIIKKSSDLAGSIIVRAKKAK